MDFLNFVIGLHQELDVEISERDYDPLATLVGGIDYALTEPSEKALVANLVGTNDRGLAYGWFNLTTGVGALPASAIFGFVYQTVGPLAAFGMGAGLALGAAALLIGVRRR